MTLVNGVYKLGARAGSGVFGVVYEATDTKHKTKVAVKVANHTYTSQARSADDYLVSEIENVHEISENREILGVVDYVDHGEDVNMGNYLVLEWLEYGIDDVDWNIKAMIQLGLQIAGILEALHSQELGHHDLHNGNWRMTKKGEVKLIDMSFSHEADRNYEDFDGLANILYFVANRVGSKEASALSNEIRRNTCKGEWTGILEMFNNYEEMFNSKHHDLVNAIRE